MTRAAGWLFLWAEAGGAGPRLREAVPEARRLGASLWVVPLTGNAPEEILAGCLGAGVRVYRSMVTAGTVELRGPAA